MILIVSLLVFLFSYACGQLTCTASSWTYDNLADGYTQVDNNANSAYLMESTQYHVPDACTCGVLVSWSLYPVGAGDLTLQVWDHVNSTTYKLVGQNFFTVPTAAINSIVEFQVPMRDRITIRNGYILGWKGVQSGIIGYKDGTFGYPDEQRQSLNLPDVTDVDSDFVYDWSSGSAGHTKYENKVYAIQGKSGSNTAPAFTNLPRTVWIYGDATPGSLIYTIAADDIDPRDVRTLFITAQNDATTPFYYNRTSQRVYLGSYSPAMGTYTLTFGVSDQCGNQGSGLLTIIVQNWGPVMSGLPAFATVEELTSDERILGNVTLSDRDNSTWDLSGTFNIDNTNADITLEYHSHDKTTRNIVSARNADYASKGHLQYIMDMRFTDGTTITDKGYFLLYMDLNSAPKFTNLNNKAKTTVSYLSTANGDFVYAVSTTDAENDAMTYTITCSPTPCPFQINDDGVITATGDLIRAYVTGYDIIVTVSDARNPSSENEPAQKRTLTVLVEDIDDKPVITNLPLAHSVGVAENTALGTLVYTVTYMDLDTTDNHTIQANWNPTWGKNYFYLNETTGELTTALNEIDFENVMVQYGSAEITLTVMVSDGQDWATATLVITLVNMNEPPSFHQTQYTVEPNEQGTVGVSVGSWDASVIDEDTYVAANAETHTYTWDCGDSTRYFRMNSGTGDVTYAVTFDYDETDLLCPFNCVVTVTDKAGLSATTILQIDIVDENDNSPVFAQTTDYYMFHTPDLAPGRLVGQVTASDKDKSTRYNTIYYSFGADYPFVKGFLLINDFGNIYVNETWTSPQFNYGLSYTMTVIAENIVDDTAVRRSATATVVLYIAGTTTTTSTTTDKSRTFIDDRRNVAWMAVALALGGALLILALGLVLLYTVQVKRYRWCIPWIRKRLLGLHKIARREKRQYYRDLLLNGGQAVDSEDSDDSDQHVTTIRDPGDTGPDPSYPPPMLWDRKKAQVPKGPTVRLASEPVHEPAKYEPKPPSKKLSRK